MTLWRSPQVCQAYLWNLVSISDQPSRGLAADDGLGLPCRLAKAFRSVRLAGCGLRNGIVDVELLLGNIGKGTDF